MGNYLQNRLLCTCQFTEATSPRYYTVIFYLGLLNFAMSSQKGNVNRTRQQKHKNTTAYKNNLYGETPRTKMLNSIQVCNVCAHCQGVLEWKIKFNKYKILTAPARCTKCLEKTVKQAYCIFCVSCAEKSQACAKCGKKEEIVAKQEPSVAEKARMDSKFQQELKGLPERKRRTFMRYLQKLEKPKETDEDSSPSDEKPKDKNWMEEAEKRLQLLKLEVEKGNKDDDEDDWSDSDDDDFDDEDDV